MEQQRKGGKFPKLARWGWRDSSGSASCAIEMSYFHVTFFFSSFYGAVVFGRNERIRLGVNRLFSHFSREDAYTICWFFVSFPLSVLFLFICRRRSAWIFASLLNGIGIMGGKCVENVYDREQGEEKWEEKSKVAGESSNFELTIVENYEHAVAAQQQSVWSIYDECKNCTLCSVMQKLEEDFFRLFEMEKSFVEFINRRFMLCYTIPSLAYSVYAQNDKFLKDDSSNLKHMIGGAWLELPKKRSKKREAVNRAQTKRIKFRCEFA